MAFNGGANDAKRLATNRLNSPTERTTNVVNLTKIHKLKGDTERKKNSRHVAPQYDNEFLNRH